MPLDNTENVPVVDPDAKKSEQPAAGEVKPPIDRKNPLAEALEKRAPQVIEQSEAQAKELEGAGRKLVGEMEHSREEYRNLKAPLPPMPTMPPQRQPTDPWMAWGSPAMAFAMLASAFTRRPAVNSMNAAAGVINAYRNGDEQAYKDAYQHWKDQTEYAHELYEYQREAYRDALEKLETDTKQGLAEFKVLSSALSDPLKRFADEGDVASLGQAMRMRDLTYDKTKLETDKMRRVGDAQQEELTALDTFQKNPTPENKRAYENARDRVRVLQQTGGVGVGVTEQQNAEDLFEKLKAAKEADLKRPINATEEAELRRQAMSAAKGTGAAAGDRTRLESELYEHLKADWFADPENAGKEFTGEVERTLRAQAHEPFVKSSAGPKDQSYVVVDKDGNAIGEPFLAHRGPNGYVRGDTGEAVKFDAAAGQKILPAPKEQGKQAEQQQWRMIGAANTADFVLHNLSRLPITASRGWLMGLETHTPDAMTTAIERSLARQMTSYDTKAMQQVAAGMGRVFGMLETQGGIQGMQTYGQAIEAALTPQAGDPPLLTMRRLADARGLIERAVETARARTKDQKQLAPLLDKILASAKESVPYTVDDVADLEDWKYRGGSENSVRNFAARMMDEKNKMTGRQGEFPTPPDEAVKDLQAHRDDPVRKASFEKHFGKAALDKALGVQP